ncbi:BtrH N-terminal domain-containing protein [Herbidospora cretacea]|uniref:BtrH N-terminal domain-containing protein n=1 Tax=Herbidospora cretacea TaxID=28444 RepID=UPI0009EDB1C4|nr:BtrH N-terminal domain-containing protein [Herbidospora cretacea]
MTILNGIEPRGTHHCETTTLGVLLRHEGLDLSEPMLFGLGSGLSFVYWESRAMAFPFLGGRVKPFELTRNLTARLGLTLRVAETTSRRKAWDNAAASIDAGRPVGLQLDCHHLDYFTTKVHFGGHVVAMYGYDEHDVHLIDTAGQGGAVRTGRESLAAARAERGPMTARNRSFTITLPERVPRWQDQIVPAIRECARTFLTPPIGNLGCRGIDKASLRIPKWRLPEEDLRRIAFLMEKGGTGGALFRALYRDFLGECAELVDDPAISTAHTLFTEAAAGWTEVAALVAETRLAEAGAILHELSIVEKNAMMALSQ